MNTFENERLVVLIEKRRVEAASELEAIVKLFDGNSELMNSSLAVFCEERGLPAEDFPTLVEELRKAGIITDETVIPSIMGIEEVNDVRVTIPDGAEVEFVFRKTA